MRHRSRSVGALSLLVPLIVAASAPGITSAATPAPGATITATVTGLRSAKGQVLACLTTREDLFPECDHDPDARKLTVPAGKQVMLDFGLVPDGHYAISLVHDENSNGKLDKRMMIPREGYGFSRDARVVMGPPSFASAAFAVHGTSLPLTIRMRYLF